MEKHSSSNNHVNGGGSRREDFEVAVDVVTLQDFSDLLHNQPNKLYSESHRQIQKIPNQIRRRNIRRSQQVYDPVLVSIGPYHHAKPGLRRAQEFKHQCLNRCAGGDDKKKAFFYSKILEEVAAIRDSYAEAKIMEKYDDKSLALMMLLDASIIIDFIHNYLGMKGNNFLDWRRCLGAGSWPLMIRDIMLMENQIPLQVLKLLIAMQYEEGEAASFLPRFFAGFLTFKTHLVGVDLENADIPDEIEDPSIHLLEAVRKVIVKKKKKKMMKKNEIKEQHILMSEYSLVNKNVFMLSRFPMREETVDAGVSYMHRSVMDLKAKGIRIRSDPDLSPGEITFVPGVCFSELHLPIQYLTPVVVENMIAFEVLPHGCSSPVVLSYAIFMKSLVQSPQDVKELQANGVMLNRFGNLENVVQMVKEVDTFGLHDQDIFKDVKRRIEEHCRSKARTWLADLVYSRFRTPWTAIALFAGVLLLCLTFVQTFFTIWPTNQRAL
ncbi:putative UPF0481 protein At3g02645 [Salvia hispanica]|uniref:putative UPF0481 protein At3g02645 n=1 Tax=Salvia hispanica TaxID=49212 RepID=UPI002009DA25|nr:putative UPF0481 protein At3g02645 [Salvia hispanica]